ncbi:hypothetical protein ACIBBD_28855 [Streptomyces sp. NPDC051315]|uniref:hypothetical protein n=1 Tax=Streptomyces sp. NPDC051315 TaxID=3365650 RepID=UPI0037A9AFB6
MLRLEQDRATNPSAQVASAIARTLRLPPAERDQLFLTVPPGGERPACPRTRFAGHGRSGNAVSRVTPVGTAGRRRTTTFGAAAYDGDHTKGKTRRTRRASSGCEISQEGTGGHGRGGPRPAGGQG